MVGALEMVASVWIWPSLRDMLILGDLSVHHTRHLSGQQLLPLDSPSPCPTPSPASLQGW